MSASPPTGPTVAVVGASRPLGRAVVTRLAADERVGRTLAVDARRRAVDGATWRIVDPLDAALTRKLAGVDVVVHAALDQSPEFGPGRRRDHNLAVTENLLAAATSAGCGRVVAVTSAMVHGAQDDNPVPLDCEAPLRAPSDDGVVAELLAVEDMLTDHAAAGHAVTVMRPAAVVGEGVDSFIVRHFEAPRLLVVKDSSPVWQFAHVDDVGSAVAAAIVHGLDGPLSVGCEGWLTQDELEQIGDLRRIELPGSLVDATAERLHRLGVTPSPASELAYVRYPWAVSSRRLRETGWVPAVSNVEALRLLLDSAASRTTLVARRLGRTDAASLGAAGATAALLGAAAVVRARRRRLGG